MFLLVEKVCFLDFFSFYEKKSPKMCEKCGLFRLADGISYPFGLGMTAASDAPFDAAEHALFHVEGFNLSYCGRSLFDRRPLTLPFTARCQHCSFCVHPIWDRGSFREMGEHAKGHQKNQNK